MTFINDSYENGRVSYRTVATHEIDELGHVNNAEYVKWIQDAATEHWFAIAQGGLSDTYMWFCSRHEIDYKGQLFEADEIEIRTWLGEPKGARFDRFVDIRKKDSKTPAVIAKTTWVLMSKDKGRPMRMQPDILSAFS